VELKTNIWSNSAYWKSSSAYSTQAPKLSTLEGGLEQKSFTTLRDTLLPRLISGQLRVGENQVSN
jgi:hypothetical protein